MEEQLHKNYFNSLSNITFSMLDDEKKVLNKVYVQFCEQILNFEGEVMVQTSGTFFMDHLVYCAELTLYFVNGFFTENKLIHTIYVHRCTP